MAETLQRLHAETGPDRPEVTVGFFNTIVGANSERRSFLGRALADGAEVRVNLNTEPGDLRQWNSFQALVRVRVEPSGRGAAVHASMRLHLFPMFFLAALATPFALLTAYLASAIARGESPAWSIAIAPAFLFVIWLFVCFFFSEDAETAERLLRATLERD